MKNTTLFILILIGLFILGAFFLYPSLNNRKITGNSLTDQSLGSTQKITLSFRNYNYYPNEIHVKVNQPVEITLDNSIKGCYRSFNIRDLGVSQNSAAPSDKIKFTPSQKGKFGFACSMGMGTGTIIVE